MSDDKRLNLAIGSEAPSEQIPSTFLPSPPNGLEYERVVNGGLQSRSAPELFLQFRSFRFQRRVSVLPHSKRPPATDSPGEILDPLPGSDRRIEELATEVQVVALPASPLPAGQCPFVKYLAFASTADRAKQHRAAIVDPSLLESQGEGDLAFLAVTMPPGKVTQQSDALIITPHDSAIAYRSSANAPEGADIAPALRLRECFDDIKAGVCFPISRGAGFLLHLPFNRRKEFIASNPNSSALKVSISRTHFASQNHEDLGRESGPRQRSSTRRP